MSSEGKQDLELPYRQFQILFSRDRFSVL